MSLTSQSLPERFPIFPLRGALLLPTGNLPLNIFEPRYLSMVRDAMQTDRVIGMVQQRHDRDPSRQPEIFLVGCAGRITNFNETDDGRYLITLTGVIRFDVEEELEAPTLYRQVRARFDRWHGDLQPETPPEHLRDRMLPVLQSYFQAQGIEADWDAIREARLASLIVSLAMICPFDAAEKQALLEASTLEQQGDLLVAIMEMESMAVAAPRTAMAH